MSHSSALPEPDALREALREVIDPEVGINIVDLGLVYRIAFEDGVVVVEMTMTSPACPLGEMIADEVDEALRRHLPPNTPIDVRLVWEPPWTPEKMSEAARRHFDRRR
ncbi:metal-sulfur cluster assembly factor [Sulfuricystis multivorans]|uniref:metal-sulfur cluster assembly factor n=1 Tax=Sulfuricystis multivorans TaxID=2211108 RepID=UPI000F82F82A|nr:metal-sulfur cluster assembly factor [Sulfuricystis multivorans]